VAVSEIEAPIRMGGCASATASLKRSTIRRILPSGRPLIAEI
jgi:hypothetical protein